jgi:hypothetical protein
MVFPNGSNDANLCSSCRCVVAVVVQIRRSGCPEAALICSAVLVRCRVRLVLEPNVVFPIHVGCSGEGRGLGLSECDVMRL